MSRSGPAKPLLRRSPIRVSLDVSAVPAQPVGAGQYTLELVRALLDRDDVVLTLWCRHDDIDRWCHLHPVPRHAPAVRGSAPVPRPSRLAWEQMALPWLLRGAGVDVHHAPHYTMPEHAAVPRVVTIHDLTFFDHPEWHERAKVPLFRRAIRVATRHADVLVCVSDRTAARLEELFAPVGRVIVVPHGVDAQRFRPSDESGADEQVLRSLGVRSPYVLYVGTIEPRKAVPDLVAAFDRLAAGRADLSLVLAGSPGWGNAEVERALATARAGDRVLRTGYVADDAVPALLRCAAAVAYPARAEGFGLPALEALACGAPLVTTVGTAMAELAGDAAFLVPPGSVPDLADALAEAVAHGPAVRARRQQGLQVAAAYTWSAAAAGHMAAYHWASDAGTPAKSDDTASRRRTRH